MLLAVLLVAGIASAATPPPNIVFIIADDLGYADVAFHGGSAPTPHLDRLAREGVELTQHYVAATCTPTRSGLMSGRFWSRFGIAGPDNKRAFRWDQLTLARALKGVGYETALIGKWHLGSKPEWGPGKFGFDHSYGSLAGGVGPYNHFYKQGEFSVTWHRNGRFITEEGHVTDLIVREAEQWIAQRGAQPFFLYLPFTAVHLPVKEPQAWLDRVPAAITGEVARQYAASIMHLDDAVGRVLAALEQAGKRGNTLVIFTSDNGGSTAENNDTQYPADGYVSGRLTGSNRPLRGGKGDLYEGGIRVPTVANWPGRLRPGRCDVPLHIVDWMPTLTKLAGFRAEGDPRWDGADVWPQISGASRAAPSRPLYWTTPRARAVREGDWKLIEQPVRGEAKARVELFHVAADPNETTELAARHPDRVAALQATLAAVAARDRDAVAND